VAGLLPFQRPRNEVTWLVIQNGLHFGHMGTILSNGTLQVDSANDETTCSLEMWVKSDPTKGTRTILAFATNENPLQLSVLEYQRALILKRVARGIDPNDATIGIDNVFGQIEPIFLTITSGTEKTSIYVDGHLAETFPRFRLGNSCTGQLVIGTSTVETDAWSGDFRGLAVYQSELTPTEVLRHYKTWTVRGRPAITESETAAAVFLLDEHAGNLVHNAVHPGIDLIIPKRFSLWHQNFLEPFWKEFRPTRSYWIDVLINIAGFIPFGFIFCAYWSYAQPIKHPALATVLLGFAVSFTIETVQAHLPTRSSSSTDVITNTLGTILGVRLYGSHLMQTLLARFKPV
jgi:VanZ family protein